MVYELSHYHEACDFIKSKIQFTPQIALVLGSGFSTFTENLTDCVVIPYGEIPNFPKSTVSSHEGKMYIGKISGKNVLVMSGRFHYYEGHDMDKTSFPIRVLKLLGVENIILTNAAGGINPKFNVGDLMVIKDHIKLCESSPVRGRNLSEFGPRFFDMSNAYDKTLQTIAFGVMKDNGIALKTGVYAFMSGPQFETPSEVKLLSILGADAVGMSTVAETICAVQCGINVVGISCISNMAAGISSAPITDEEVCEVTRNIKDKIDTLLCGIIERI